MCYAGIQRTNKHTDFSDRIAAPSQSSQNHVANHIVFRYIIIVIRNIRCKGSSHEALHEQVGPAWIEGHHRAGLAGLPLEPAIAAPILSEAMAGLYSSQVAMRWPYLIMGILFLVCVKIAFAAVWRLLSLSGSGTVFTATAMPCVNWVLGCAAIATALTVLVSLCFLISGWHDATMQAMDYYTIALVLGVAILAEIGFMLLMVVMKGLMHLFQRR